MFSRGRSRSVVTSPKKTRHQKLAAACAFEGLEDRRLMTVYSPHGTPLLTMTEGVANSGNVVATFASTDPQAGLTAVINWGAGMSPAASVGTINLVGSEFVPGVGTVPQYTVTGGATAPTFTNGGPVPFTVTVADSADASTAVMTGAVQVVDAPLTTTGGISSATVVQGINVNYSGAIAPMTFTDANPNSVAADFDAIIDWGDGTPATRGIVTKSGSTYSVAGQHTYVRQTASPFTLAVTVTDGGTSVARHTTSVTVNDAALTTPTGAPVAGTSGQALHNVLLGTFVDTNPYSSPAEYATSIDWGDGSPAESGVVALIGGTSTTAKYAVYGSHTYTSAVNSPFAVAVTVNEVGGQSTTINTAATIAPARVTATAAPLVLQAGADFVAGTRFGTFVDAGLGTATYTATALIAGTPVPLTVTPTALAGHYLLLAAAQTPIPGGLSVGHHAYALTVTGDDGSGALADGSLTVSAAPLTLVSTAPAIAATEGAPLTNRALLTFTAADPAAAAADFLASIDWGDGSPRTTGDVTLVAGQFVVTGSHTYKHAADNLTVRVTVTDDAGQRVTGTTAAFDVDNAATTPGAAAAVAGVAGQSLNHVLLGTFTDANPYALATDYSASINWGDGVTAARGTIAPIGGTSAGVIFGVFGDHTYAAAHTQPVPIAVTVSDKDGGAMNPFSTSATIKAAAVAGSAATVTGTIGAIGRGRVTVALTNNASAALAGATRVFLYASPYGGKLGKGSVLLGSVALPHAPAAGETESLRVRLASLKNLPAKDDFLVATVAIGKANTLFAARAGLQAELGVAAAKPAAAAKPLIAATAAANPFSAATASLLKDDAFLPTGPGLF